MEIKFNLLKSEKKELDRKFASKSRECEEFTNRLEKMGEKSLKVNNALEKKCQDLENELRGDFGSFEFWISLCRNLNRTRYENLIL